MKGRIRRLYFHIGGTQSTCKRRSATAQGNTDDLIVLVDGGCVDKMMIRAIVMNDTKQEFHRFAIDGGNKQERGKVVRLALGLKCGGDHIVTSYDLLHQPPEKDIEIRYQVYDADDSNNCSNTATVHIKHTCT